MMTGKDVLLLALREKICKLYNRKIDVKGLVLTSMKDMRLLKVCLTIHAKRGNLCAHTAKQIRNIVREYCTMNSIQTNKLISTDTETRAILVFKVNKETAKFYVKRVSRKMDTLRQAVDQVEDIVRPFVEILQDEKKLFELCFFGCDPSSDIYKLSTQMFHSRIKYPASLKDILSLNAKEAWFHSLDLLNAQLIAATNNNNPISPIRYLHVGNVTAVPLHFRRIPFESLDGTIFTIDNLFSKILSRYPFLFAYIVSVIYMNYETYKRKVFKYIMR